MSFRIDVQSFSLVNATLTVTSILLITALVKSNRVKHFNCYYKTTSSNFRIEALKEFLSQLDFKSRKRTTEDMEQHLDLILTPMPPPITFCGFHDRHGDSRNLHFEQYCCLNRPLFKSPIDLLHSRAASQLPVTLFAFAPHPFTPQKQYCTLIQSNGLHSPFDSKALPKNESCLRSQWVDTRRSVVVQSKPPGQYVSLDDQLLCLWRIHSKKERRKESVYPSKPP